MKNKTFKSFLFAAILFSVLGVSGAFAQNSTPEAVIKELYKIHNLDMGRDNGTDRILGGKDRKLLDRFFDKSLADLIWKDLKSNSDEVGVLDFDPFYNAQDFDIKGFSVGKAKIVGGKATVTVKFVNAGRRDILNYRLIRRNSGWKIANIEYGEGASLLKYFAEGTANSSN
jgi:hypothetical protein